MAMTVLITLTAAGADLDNFELYSDTDAYTTPFETGITRAQLLAGFTSVVVPDSTTIIRATSTGLCTNSLDINLVTTTTTTTTAAPSTLVMLSSPPSGGTAVLDILGGEAGEIIYVDVEITVVGGSFSTLIFGAPAAIPQLDPVHLTRSGYITLDGSGNASSTFVFDAIATPTTAVVTITSRDSGLLLPVVDSVTIINS